MTTIRAEIRSTLHLGWPIILGNLTQMSLGIIDSAMVGSIHSSQLAASSFVNNIITVPLILGMGLSMAISPLVATAQGAGDYDRPLRILFNGLLLCMAIIGVLAVVIHASADVVYHLGQDPIVAELGRPYLIWMGWSMVPMVQFMAMKQFADGLGLTRWAMYLSALALPINTGLNYLFIFGHWGIPRYELMGAGIATFITRALLVVLMIWVIAHGKQFAPYRQHLRQQLEVRVDRLRDLIRLGIPSSMQYGMEAGAFAVSGIMAGWLGFQQQAAHQIALNLAAFTFMVSLGISAAGSIRVAYAHGSQEWPRVRQIGVTAIGMAVVYGMGCALLFISGRHILPLIFNTEPVVVGFAANLLILAGIFQISDSVQAVGVGLLRGLQDVKKPTFFVALAYWGIGIPAGYALAFIAGWAVNGLWVGLLLGLSASALLLSARFRRLTHPAHQ